MGSSILLVEDEESLAVGLEYNLNEEGYRVVRAADGREALARFAEGNVDLIILDLMLPHVDGLEVARRVREVSPQLPILMLTARGAAADRVRGLEAGADDYLTKPFHLQELLLRVRGMLRRKHWYRDNLASVTRTRIGPWEVDFTSLRCSAPGRVLRLTPLEGGLLRYLVVNAGRVVSREELLKNVWQASGGVETRTVDNFVLRLRKYFEPEPAAPRYFRNVRGAGYEFQPD
jgi:two-component system alkaline phosphatase synthesis response regulator PhoP